MNSQTTFRSSPSSTHQQWVRLVFYFVIAYGFTWLFWGATSLIARGQLTLPIPPFALMILGGLGPMVAAIIATGLEQGSKGVRALFKQLLRFRVSLGWYVAALVVLPLLRFVPALLHLVLGGVWPAEEVLGQLTALPFLFLFVALVGGGIDEEMGWRGYALPRLQNLTSPLKANLILGVVWACWHLPLWFIPDTDQAALAFPLYLISTTALSFILGWIYNGTKGSLLLAVLAHTASNLGDNFRATVLRSNTDPTLDMVFQLVLTGVMVTAALMVVVRTRGTLLSPLGKQSSEI
jgi:uncharacterized protein